MITNTEQPFIFICWDKVVSGTGYIKSFSINYGYHELSSMGSIFKHMRYDGTQGVDVSILAKHLNIEYTDNPNKIRYKHVKDCSVDELIVALREKIKAP